MGGLGWRNGRGTEAGEGLFWTLRETASRPSGSSERQAVTVAVCRRSEPLGVSRKLGESSDFWVPSQQFCSRSGVHFRKVPGLSDAGSSHLRADADG